MTCDTGDMGHMTHDRWKELNLPFKCQLPSSYSFGDTGDRCYQTTDMNDKQVVVNIVSNFQVPSFKGLGVMAS